jgi:CDP-diacylglycerol---glycerol-3-phosphate 3-phosphatidyltransferase
VNLPNAITVARIIVTPLIALLPFVPSTTARLAAFLLYVVAAVTDYYDGMLARTRGLVTDLGRLLDPLADKLLLLGTLVPMFLLTGSGTSPSFLSPHRTPLVAGVAGPMLREGTSEAAAFPFLTSVGPVGLPWWLVAVILGREVFMTIFRQAAARRGVIIAAIGPAKWKTGFQSTWVGTAYFWFFAATLAAERGWTSGGWRAFGLFTGSIGVVTMVGAFVLTLYSLWLYLRRYGGMFRR